MRISMISVPANPLVTLDGRIPAAQHLHVAELAAAMVRAGHQVTVFTRRDARKQPVTVEAPQGYRVVHVPAGPVKPLSPDELLPHVAEFTRYVGRHWDQNPPDVVHSHRWLSGLVAVFAGLRRPAPVVHSYHGLGAVRRRHLGDADTSPADRVRTERLIGRSAARVLVSCTDEVRELGRMGVTGSRVTVVPGGVDAERFRPEGPAAAKRLPHRVVSIGRLVQHKGFAELVAALPYNPDTELVIVGGPERAGLDTHPEARRLTTLARRLDVADRVRLVGRLPHDRLPALLRSADLVACTPSYEPFGLVALEAMACGVPVLATAVGGLADTVVDKVTGVLVPPRRPRSIAAAMQMLLADPVKRSFLGAAGRDRAESRYPWSRIAADTLRIYERCVARSAPSGGADRLATAGSV